MTEGFPTIPLGDRNQEMIPFTRDTQLVGYLTLPKSLFHLGLSPGALLVYTLLLDRGKLSQRSGWRTVRPPREPAARTGLPLWCFFK